MELNDIECTFEQVNIPIDEGKDKEQTLNANIITAFKYNEDNTTKGIAAYTGASEYRVYRVIDKYIINKQEEFRKNNS